MQVQTAQDARHLEKVFLRQPISPNKAYDPRRFAGVTRYEIWKSSIGSTATLLPRCEEAGQLDG